MHLFDKKVTPVVINNVKDVRKPLVTGMEQMLKLCGLELIGKHHSGIDDSRNIAACVVRSLQEGYTFT